MAFDINKVGGYGTGSLGNVTIPYDDNGIDSWQGKVCAYPNSIETYNVNPYEYLEEYTRGDIYHNDLEIGGTTLYHRAVRPRPLGLGI